MQRPFGHILSFKLVLSRAWLSLGPGWAALAGAMSVDWADFEPALLWRLLSLWLLVDPILGTLWDLSVRQGLWQRMSQAELPPPPTRGFYIPYAQPGTAAGRLVLQGRRYQVWWRENYWPEFGERMAAFGLGAMLALLLSLFLSPAIFGLTLLALGLTIWAGQNPPDLTAPGGGRLQSLVQLLLPWLMGMFLWAMPATPGFILGICFWAVYLGGLRMLGSHRRAEFLFFLGQLGAILVLAALRLLPGAAVLSVFFITQLLIKTKFHQPTDFLPKVQPYLILAMLIAGLSLQAAG